MSANADPNAEQSAEETPLVADPNADDSSEDSAVEEKGTLSDSEINLLNKLEDLPETDQLDKIETMEASGRSDEAGKMREILGLEKPTPTLDEAELQALLTKELEARGITPDLLDEMSKNRQSSVRTETITKLGLDPNNVSKDEKFLKAYHSPDLKDKSVEDRTELAIARAYVGRTIDPQKEAKAKSMAVSGSGDHKSKAKSFNDMSASEQSKALETMNNDDLAKMFG